MEKELPIAAVVKLSFVILTMEQNLFIQWSL